MPPAGAAARMSMRAGSLPATEPAPTPQPRAAADLAQRFIEVCDGGDVRGLIGLLDPEVAGLATVMGVPPLPPIRGAAAVASRALQFFGPSAGVRLEPFALEHRTAVVAHQNGQAVAVVRLDERTGRIVHMHAIALLFRPASVSRGL